MHISAWNLSSLKPLRLELISLHVALGSKLKHSAKVQHRGGAHPAEMLYEILGILAIGGVATGLRSWCAHTNAALECAQVA